MKKKKELLDFEDGWIETLYSKYFGHSVEIYSKRELPYVKVSEKELPEFIAVLTEYSKQNKTKGGSQYERDEREHSE